MTLQPCHGWGQGDGGRCEALSGMSLLSLQSLTSCSRGQLGLLPKAPSLFMGTVLRKELAEAQSPFMGNPSSFPEACVLGGT